MRVAPPRPRARGFTVLEVMISVMILALAFVVLLRHVATSISGAVDAQQYGVITDLARAKMHDIEEELIKDGFGDLTREEGECGDPDPKTSRPGLKGTPEEEAKRLDERDAAIRKRAETGETFEKEGFPRIRYTYRVDQIQIPSMEQIQAAMQEQAEAALVSDDSGSAAMGGGMLSMLGSLGANSASSMQMSLFQDVLKAAIRKVTLCVYYEEMGTPYELITVAYFTDSAAMDKVLQGFGAQELADGEGSAGPAGSAGSGPRPPGSPNRPGDAIRPPGSEGRR